MAAPKFSPVDQTEPVRGYESPDHVPDSWTPTRPGEIEGFQPEGTGPEQREDADAYNSGETNITGHPSLSVPAGVCPNGIPFGLQITGPRFRDDLVLNLGEVWEAANPWPLAAPGYEPFAI